MEPLVSVIVPVYNTEKYLRRCIDSILRQTHSHLEAILVDDGSPDRCGEICDEYAQADKRVIVKHQTNQGVVLSRMVGHTLASGEYILYVDSDDWIDADMVELVQNVAIEQDSDMVYCDVMGEHLGHSYCANIRFAPTAKQMLHNMLRGDMPSWICNKLIRRSFIDEIELFYSPKDSILEDFLLQAQLLLANPKVASIDKPLYHYNRTNASAQTNTENKTVMIDAANNIQYTAEILQKAGAWDEYKADFAHTAMQVKIAYLNIGDIRSARGYMPEAHKRLSAYPLASAVACVYWVFFNLGKLGEWAYRIYRDLHTFRLTK